MSLKRRVFRVLKWMVLSLAVIFLTFVILFFYQTSYTKQMHAYVYELPFEKGTSHRVFQGYGGLFSHSNIAALDFAMPVGTPIYAARAGTVYNYKDDSDEGGLNSSFKRKANYIMIQHDDGSIGCYWHLEKNGVVTKRGRVESGQLIGKSGATGFVLQPHLHFSVKRKLNYSMDAFTQTKFKTADGIEVLRAGRMYRKP